MIHHFIFRQSIFFPMSHHPYLQYVNWKQVKINHWHGNSFLETCKRFSFNKNSFELIFSVKTVRTVMILHVILEMYSYIQKHLIELTRELKVQRSYSYTTNIYRKFCQKMRLDIWFTKFFTTFLIKFACLSISTTCYLVHAVKFYLWLWFIMLSSGCCFSFSNFSASETKSKVIMVFWTNKKMCHRTVFVLFSINLKKRPISFSYWNGKNACCNRFLLSFFFFKKDILKREMWIAKSMVGVSSYLAINATKMWLGCWYKLKMLSYTDKEIVRLDEHGFRLKWNCNNGTGILVVERRKNNNPGGNIQSIFSKDINASFFLFLSSATPHAGCSWRTKVTVIVGEEKWRYEFSLSPKERKKKWNICDFLSFDAR